MKKGFSKKIYIYSFCFAILCSLLVCFVVIPLLESIKENSKKVVLEKREQLFLSQEKENLKGFKAVFQEIEPDLNKIDTLFISSSIPIDFINFLEELASNSNVTLGVSSLSLKEKDSWSILELNLETSGSFVNFSRFVEKLENSIYLIEIYDLHIKKLGDISEEDMGVISIGNVAVSMSLRVFAK